MMPSTEFESGPSSDRGDSSEEMVTLQSPLRCWQTQSQNCVLQFSQLHKQFEGTGSRSPPARHACAQVTELGPQAEYLEGSDRAGAAAVWGRQSGAVAECGIGE